VDFFLYYYYYYFVHLKSKLGKICSTCNLSATFVCDICDGLNAFEFAALTSQTQLYIL